MNRKKALIAGSTGLIGKELLRHLLEGEAYEQVVALVRRPLNMNHPKLIEKVVDFDHLEENEAVFQVDDVFCCLGTTIKNAKTKEAMWKIDVEYPLSIARLANKRGAKQFFLVSSMNANENSRIWYSRMKGQLEMELQEIPFEHTGIIRPSLLIGARKEFRLGEKIAGSFMTNLEFLFKGPLEKYKAIKGETVAKAMYRIAQGEGAGTRVYPSFELQRLGV